MAAQVPKPDEMDAVMSPSSLPPLNLTAGPAISGAGQISTPLQTGAFTYGGSGAAGGWGQLAGSIPLVVVVGAVAAVMIFRK